MPWQYWIIMMVVGVLILFGQRHLHHLSVYTGSLAAATTDSDLAAVADPAVTITNNHPIFPVPVQAYWAHGWGATTLTRLKLVTPKIRAINNLNLRPLDPAAAISSRPPLVEFFHHPISLNPLDENQILITQAAVAATQFYCAVAFGDGNFNVPGGDMFAVHTSQSVTLVANGWAAGVMTLDQPLPSGRYSVVGLEAYGTNLLYARLVFPNQVWRPGILAGTANTFITSRYFRWGNLGEWGQFESFAIPQIDTLGSAAGAQTIDVTMDLIRVR